MNRIDLTFQTLRDKKKKAFLAFITAGDPSLKATEELVLAFERSGVDIVELGVPFSDPLADGPTIQASSQRALNNKVSLEKIIRTVENIRKRSNIPIVLMTYYNPVFSLGEERFVRQAKQAGVDGVIIPDLPPEEAAQLIRVAKKADFRTIFFISPTTTSQRMKTIVKASTGFIYYVSLTGVTGSRSKLPSDIVHQIKKAKRLTKQPICIGFGISNPTQVKELSRISDGVIVGSAIVKAIVKNQGKANLVRNVESFVRSLTAQR